MMISFVGIQCTAILSLVYSSQPGTCSHLSKFLLFLCNKQPKPLNAVGASFISTTLSPHN